MKRRWIWAWALQIAEMLAVCLVEALCAGLHAGLHAALLWGLVPLAGLFTSCQAVRRGLLNYAAWLAPAVCLYGINMLVWGFAPPAGAALLTAFLSLVGAAAGEVLVQREASENKKKNTRR